MKILHITFSFTIGGTENMLVDIANEQSKTENVTIIIINDHYDEKVIEMLSPRVNLILLDRKPGITGIFPLIKLQFLTLFLNPDLIHIHHKDVLRMFPKIFGRLRKYIFTVHDTKIKFGSYLKNADTIFSISKSVQNDLLERYNITSTVNYNGIKFKNIVKKEDSSAFEGTMKIVQVSRLMHEKKGQDILLYAISKLQNNIPIQVDFIGDGPSLEYLKNLSTELNLNKQVHFLGNLSKKDVYEKLHEYDLLVQPSRYEGFGLTIVEGIAAGLPVLVSNIEGPMEIIKNGECGFAFPVGDVESCKSQIEKIYKLMLEGNLSQLKEKAYLHCSQNFQIENTAKNYLCKN